MNNTGALDGEIVSASEGTFTDAYLDDWTIEFVTALEIAAVQSLYNSDRVRGPLYPMDSFQEDALERIRSAIVNEKIHAYDVGGRIYLSKPELERLLPLASLHIGRWDEDTAAVVAIIDEMQDIPSPARGDHQSRNAEPLFVDDLPGPIKSLETFDNEARQILQWCVQQRLIRGLRLDGTTYVCYEDTQKSFLPDYFEHNYGCLVSWDHTYSDGWSCITENKGMYTKPLGCRDPIFVDKDPLLLVHRKYYCGINAFGNECRKVTSYPRSIATRAAEKFRELYRQEGYRERMKEGAILIAADSGTLLVEPLAQFSEYEVSLFEQFIADGGVRASSASGEICIYAVYLLHYERFASGLMEEEIRDQLKGKRTEMQLQEDGSLIPYSISGIWWSKDNPSRG